MKLISIYPNMSNFGGAQKVLCDLHNGIKTFQDKYIAAFDQFDELNAKYEIRNDEYIQLSLSNLKFLNNSVILSHHRKLTTILFWLIKFKIINVKVIHVAHNEFSTLGHLSFHTENIIAVSERVKKNHIQYFGIKEKNIEVIYNGLKDTSEKIKRDYDKNNITILYPARITHIKNQIKLVNILKTYLPNNIKILFAGNGEDLEELKDIIKDDKRFEALGFVENMSQLYIDSDFVMLYSLQEGLPLTLIEALIYSKPILCNNVGGNEEIVENSVNGFMLNDDKELKSILESLQCLSPSEYLTMSLQARKTYEDKFKFDTMIEKYEAYIQKVLK